MRRSTNVECDYDGTLFKGSGLQGVRATAVSARTPYLSFASRETDIVIPILFEEPHFLLVNKPAGLFTQAAPGVDSLEVQLAEQLRLRDQHPGTPFVGLPHRLDRGTSGILLVARNQRALKRFGAQFQSRLVQKFYVALVEGELTDDEVAGRDTIWEDYLCKVENEPRAEVVDSATPGAKLAQMAVKSIVCEGGRSLVLVQLLTGRMHQIRVQLAHRGFPILGDRTYGSQNCLGEGEVGDERHAPHALHALRLEFRHPQTAIQLCQTAPFPEYWSSSLSDFEVALRALQSRSQRDATTPWNLTSW